LCSGTTRKEWHAGKKWDTGARREGRDTWKRRVGRDGTDGRDGIPGMNGIPGRQGLPEMVPQALKDITAKRVKRANKVRRALPAIQ